MANAAKIQVSGSDGGNAATAHVDTFARQHLPPRELWPEFIFSRPELHYPPRLNCVSYFLDRWVEQGHGDAPCAISPAASYTYRELQALVNRIANVLVGKLGLVTGGRVLPLEAEASQLVAPPALIELVLGEEMFVERSRSAWRGGPTLGRLGAAPQEGLGSAL